MFKRGLDDRFDRAIEAFNQADFPAAIGILNGLVAKEPANSEAWLKLGICYLNMRQLGPATEALARAVIADPERATAHCFLGTAYGAAGELERASACFRRAIEIDPDHPKAEQHLIQIESLLESRAHYRAGLRFLYSSQPSIADLNQALRELVESAAIYENSPARDNLRECAKRLLALQSEYRIPIPITAELETWAAACHRGYACAQIEDWAGACEAYREALEERSEDAFVYHALGFCFLGLDRMAGTVRSWLRVLELDPGYDFTRFGRLLPRR